MFILYPFMPHLSQQSLNSHQIKTSMEILNSKAYYLKNYIPRRKSTAEDRKHHLPPLHRYSSNKLEDMLRIRNVSRSRQNSYSHHSRNNQSSNSSVSYKQGIYGFSQGIRPKETAAIFDKEKAILRKVIDHRVNESRKRRLHTIGSNSEYIVLEKHPLGEVDTLEVESMKPTERYFHKMNNIFLAEKLLLAKPSSECSIKHLRQFHNKQTEYKSNITKLSFRGKRETELSRLKLLNRRKWLG